MFKFGTEQRLMDLEMCAQFGLKKPKASRVISRFRRFVIYGIWNNSRRRRRINFKFGMQVGIHERLLCAKFRVLKLLGS